MTAEFAIIVFVTLGTVLFFLLPRLYGKFHDNPMIDLIITRCCYIIGFYLLVMNSAVVLEIATTAGYDAPIIIRYMWLFGMAGWLMLFVVGIKMIFDIVELYKKLINEKRGLE